MYSSLLEMISKEKIDTPMTKYPLHEQLQEIDRRLLLLYTYCQDKSVLMTKTHIYCTLGIDDSTFARWTQDISRPKDGSRTKEEDEHYRAARGVIIKKWLDYAQSAGMELVSSKDKPAGPIFGMKSVYQYREYDDKQQVNINLGIEDFLGGKQSIPDILLDNQDK